MRARIASAGTGKTTSLVLRYLELVRSGTPLRRIAGATYTRMAAFELSGRVGLGIDELLRCGHYLGLVRIADDERPLFEEAKRELAGATLTTIHGFMIDALRLSAPVMGLDPEFEVLAEAEGQLLFEEEVKTLLFLARDPTHRFHADAQKLGSDADELLLQLFTKRTLVENFRPTARDDGDSSQPTTVNGGVNSELNDWGGSSVKRAVNWGVNRTVNPAPGSLLTTPINGGVNATRSSSTGAASESEPLAVPGAHERSNALVRLFAASLAAYLDRLGGRRLAPGEIERRALELLSSRDAISRVRSRYRVLLVDEFQDVNPMQGRFFEALDDCGIEVEVVGDPKQSIYGFRNADPAVFRRVLEVGEVQPPLTKSYRHSHLINRFLNRLTRTLASHGLGFTPDEAPEVTTATPDLGSSSPGDAPPSAGAASGGRIEVHWVTGNEPTATLRKAEASLLAQRLGSLHAERDLPYSDMAVLAKSHHSLTLVEQALAEAGVPVSRVQARGFFEKLEIRDLYNALRAAVEPTGVPFAAWLRGPFGRLSPPQVTEVLSARDREAALERVDSVTAERYRRLRELVLLPPIEALKRLIREPVAGERSYFSSLSDGERENVDALLAMIAFRPPLNLEVLLRYLETMKRQADSGEVPRGGRGVSLLTVHAAKGLEWPLVAVFDLGRDKAPNRDRLRVDPESGEVSLPNSAAFVETGKKLAVRDEAEGYRLLYVAASRPRQILLLTGSVRAGETRGWARALDLMGIGPDARPRNDSRFQLSIHVCPSAPVGSMSGSAPELAPSQQSFRALPEWIDTEFEAHPFPPLLSPSRLAVHDSKPSLRGATAGAESSTTGDERDDEPIAPGSLLESAGTPGRGSTVGTLVHYAISQGWSPHDPAQLANLRAQEVMFPFPPDDQDDILQEVGEMLLNYLDLLGSKLPRLVDRDQDEVELPIAFRRGPTVVQGVVDRLYRVGARWYLDDYKTDRSVEPERYLTQLAIYVEAVRRARGVVPEARLVYLRSGVVVPVESRKLELAYERLPALHGSSAED